jgi:hypothetical protein
MAYRPYIKVSGAWQPLTINWTEVINGPTNLSDLAEDNTSMHIAGNTTNDTIFAPNNTLYTTFQMRNIVLSTGDATGGSNGDIWIKYTTT